MNNNLLSRYRYAAILLFALFIIVAGVIIYFQKTETITVSYKNTSKVALYSRADIDNGQMDKKQPVKVFKESGENVRLLKGKYVIYYEGKTGYENKYIYVDLNDSVKLSINPFYSDDKLVAILTDEQVSINEAINSNVHNINKYQLSEGELLNNGDWYVTTMKYIGEDFRNYDSLKIILHKNNGSWEVIKPGPQIQFGYDTHKNIPENVIDSVNSLKPASFDSSFTQPATHGSL